MYAIKNRFACRGGIQELPAMNKNATSTKIMRASTFLELPHHIFKFAQMNCSFFQFTPMANNWNSRSQSVRGTKRIRWWLLVYLRRREPNWVLSPGIWMGGGHHYRFWHQSQVFCDVACSIISSSSFGSYRHFFLLLWKSQWSSRSSLLSLTSC